MEVESDDVDGGGAVEYVKKKIATGNVVVGTSKDVIGVLLHFKEDPKRTRFYRCNECPLETSKFVAKLLYAHNLNLYVLLLLLQTIEKNCLIIVNNTTKFMNVHTVRS